MEVECGSLCVCVFSWLFFCWGNFVIGKVGRWNWRGKRGNAGDRRRPGGL